MKALTPEIAEGQVLYQRINRPRQDIPRVHFKYFDFSKSGQCLLHSIWFAAIIRKSDRLCKENMPRGEDHPVDYNFVTVKLPHSSSAVFSCNT